MSQHSVELVAKFKDNATPGLRRLAAEAEKTGSRQLQKAAAVKLKHQEMYSATARLGIRTEHQIRREIQRTQAAYNRLAKSGAASQRDLARAAQATKSRIKELNAEINGGASRWQRVGSGFRTVGRGVAGAAAGTAAGAYVLAQPVNRTMDFDTALRHAANTMYAGKSMNEKRAGMEEIKKSVMDAAYVGGTTPEAALEAMNTMVASGAMSGEAVKKLLPTVMKTAAAANAEGNDIANIITKALQAGFKEADIPSLLDRALQSGADGGFELKDMSRWLPQQLAAMKTAGMGATLDNFSSLLNANQLSFMTAGSTDEAGNNLVNLLAKINSQDIVSKAKKITLNGKEGFDFTASMNKRQAAGMNSLDALVDIVAEITAKDEKSAALMKQINAAQNQTAQTAAVLQSVPAGIDRTALLLEMVGGTDTESDESLLARYEERLRRPAAGGNQYDFRNWCLEVPGVVDAFIYPLRRGNGFVDAVILGENGIPSAETLAAVQAHVDAVRPVTRKNGFLALAPSIQTVDVDITITLGGSTDTDTATAAIKSAVNAYFDALKPGDTLIKSQLETLISEVYGVRDRLLNSPAGNIKPQESAEDIYWLRPGRIKVEYTA